MEASQNEPPRYLTVNQMAEKHPCFRVGGLRHWIFNARENGFDACIRRVGRRVGAYRALEDDSEGYSPLVWEEVEGKRALAPLARGKGIGPKTVSLA